MQSKMQRAKWLGLAMLAAPLVVAGCGGGGGLPGGVRLGQTTTIAGDADPGTADGPVATARFNNPVSVEIDPAGVVFVTDYDNNRVRRINAGVVDTIVNQANFRAPFGIARMPDGRLFVTTDANDSGTDNSTSGTIWQVDVATRTATVLARNIGKPRGLTAFSDTQLVVTDIGRHDVRLINVNTGVLTPLAGEAGVPGFVNGTGNAARFNRPYGAAVTREGNVLVADQNNHALRLVTPAGVVTTFSGTGTAGVRNGDRVQAQFNAPQDVAIDSLGFIYVADNFNNLVRRIRGNTVESISGDGRQGYAEGAGSQARFFGLEGLALTPSETQLIVTDGNGGSGQPFHRIRSVHVR